MTPQSRHCSGGLITYLLIGVLLLPLVLGAQQPAVYNRFQYHHYSWKTLHTPASHLYFPKGYDSLASFASVQLPDIMTTVKQEMGVPVKGIPNLVIYPSTDQLYESNIGLYSQQQQTFPTIQMKGNRVVLAFGGSYEQFRRQLKEAWVNLTWEEQLQGDMTDQLNTPQPPIPAWFRLGMTGYFAAGWSAEEETKLYYYLRYLFRDNAPFVEAAPGGGKAFCYFMEQRYGEHAALQVFFQLKQKKSLARSLRLVTKRSMDTLLVQCERYYRERYAAVSGSLYRKVPEPGAEPDSLGRFCWRDSLPADTMPLYLEQRFNAKLLSLARNDADGYLYFVLQRDNRREAYSLRFAQLGDRRYHPRPFLSYLLPPWLNDGGNDPYPVICWPVVRSDISVVMPDKGRLLLKVFRPDGTFKDSRTLYGVDGVSSLFPYDNNKWLLAASRRGRSDIVIFDGQRLRYEPLTSGLAEHIQLAVSEYGGRTRIAYRSGYPPDSLFHKDTAVRAYGVYEQMIHSPKMAEGNKGLLILKDTGYLRRERPVYAGDGVLYTGSNCTGVFAMDPAHERCMGGTTANEAPWLKDYLSALARKDSIDALLRKAKAAETPSLLRGILSPGEDPGLAGRQRDSLRRVLAYSRKKVKPYLLQLYGAYFSAQINNDYYINRYQPFQAYLGTFKFPSVGAMASGGFSDLFENHHFNIGYRLPAGTEGSDFFVRYENTARKLDWHVLFFRKVESLEPDPGRDWKDKQGFPYPQAAKVKTHYYELGFHYPLHYDWSLDFNTAARRDRTVFLATDHYSLNFEALQSWWSISSLALQVKKLQPTVPFLYKGWEGKMLVDGMASTGKQSTLLYGLRSQLAWHQPLVSHITLVLQAQAGYSGGQSHILYNFGGLDNNIVPRADTSVRFPQQSSYAFQSLITPLRGYEQNSLYGSRFALMNADLYVPLFRNLVPLRTGISAVYNLQLGLFADIAAVSSDKTLPAVSSPKYAYGFSARTLLAGYPLRFDMAWPGSFGKQPVWYLSMTIK
ncbi:BamA/TamA family outer membrane protein [Taibaiella helva]|uniref:hypothetical protein n=1 Tax=Taibaiella helva TaxID=2301235 RepID=UPI000E5940F7|nr:hypothetical protein [Taibaiella helva]